MLLWQVINKLPVLRAFNINVVNEAEQIMGDFGWKDKDDVIVKDRD